MQVTRDIPHACYEDSVEDVLKMMADSSRSAVEVADLDGHGHQVILLRELCLYLQTGGSLRATMAEALKEIQQRHLRVPSRDRDIA